MTDMPKDAGDVLARGGTLRPNGRRIDMAAERTPPLEREQAMAAQIQWHTAADLARPLSETKWVVEGLFLAPGRPHMLAGFGFSGKTIAAQALALSVAAGVDVWGHFSTSIGTVLHFDYEMGLRASQKRYQRIARGMGIQLEAIGERLRLATYPSIYLDEDGAEDAYEKACTGADLVIIDALRGATPATDENASTIRSRLDILARISEQTETTFLIIHHAGKGKSTDARQVGRGSSAIFDASGTQLVLTNGPDNLKRVEMTKTAGDATGEPLQPFFLAIEDVHSDAGLNVGLNVVYRNAAAVEVDDDGDERFERDAGVILKFVEANPNSAVTAIRGSAGMKHERVPRVLDKLVKQGRLLRSKLGKHDVYRQPQNEDEDEESPY